MLTVSALAARNGSARVLRDAALSVGAGAFVALLGGNGAGKTTLLRAIAGLHRPVQGAIQFRGAELARLSPAAILRRGVALAWDGNDRQAGFSVGEALSLGGMAGRGRQAEMLARVFTLLPPLAELRDTPVERLEPEARRLLGIGRALMTRPRLLLLDEPTAGLSEAACELVQTALVALHAAGVALLLAEQDTALALSLCDYGYVLRRGAIVAQGKPADLRQTQAAMEAFLG